MLRRPVKFWRRIVTTGTLGVVGLGVYLGEITLRLPRRPMPSGPPPTPWEETQIRSADGLVLRGWFARGSRPDAVIVLHGQTDNRLGAAGFARLFLQHGFSVLAPDLRAHGSSGGELCTYGFREVDDIRRWTSWLESKGVQRFFGFGESMGGAILLQALPVEPRLAAVVVEAPFATLREIAYDRISSRFGSRPWPGRTFLRPILETAFLYSRLVYSVPLDRVSPEDAVAASLAPVLLINGSQDPNTPIRHARRIASRRPGVTVWEIDGAGHTGAWAAAPAEFERRVVEWFK
ncbi:MAG: alpha/beta hydrolase [Bryobacteraceae bacterium]